MPRRLLLIALIVVAAASCRRGGSGDGSGEGDELRLHMQRCEYGNQLDCDTAAARLEAAGKTAAALPLLIKGCRLSQSGPLGVSAMLDKSELCKRAEAAGAGPEKLYPLGLLRSPSLPAGP